jgi:hypothetical protein
MPVAETSPVEVCARCGEPCGRGDLVCNRCSETRVRAALPVEGPPPVEEGSLDEKLARIETETGERAHHVVASIEGALGGDVKVSIAIVTAPDGPSTPPEDVWSDAVPITTLECGSSEVAAARMNWIDRATAERGLQPAEVTRRFRIGTRGYQGEPSAVGMLLDARLHMARRALGQEAAPRACVLERDADEVRVVADFTSKGIIELFSEPKATPELRAAIEAWLGGR